MKATIENCTKLMDDSYPYLPKRGVDVIVNGHTFGVMWEWDKFFCITVVGWKSVSQLGKNSPYIGRDGEWIYINSLDDIRVVTDEDRSTFVLPLNYQDGTNRYAFVR